MNIFEIEEHKNALFATLAHDKFPISKLKSINSFVKLLYSTKTDSIIDAFLIELLPYYYEILKDYDPIGMNPKSIKNDIEYLNVIISKLDLSETVNNINLELERINNGFNNISDSLNGKKPIDNLSKLSFPVNIQSSLENQKFGQIETFSVKIHSDSSLKDDKFIVIPSREKIDEQLKEQISNSWEIALKYLRKYHRRANEFHEIVIIFDHKYADIVGYSLGVALALAFLSELFQLYNTPYTLSLLGNTTFTGGIDKNGKITNLGKDIIASKVETVFFSQFRYFAIPEADYQFAKDRLEELRNDFPNRRLKLIQSEDFVDLLNFRQIIQIEKARLPKRAYKVVKSNMSTFLLSLILLSIIGTYSIYDFDDNPNEFQFVGKSLNILNKSGKLLWSKKIGLVVPERIHNSKYFQRIYDIDHDGVNEVIICHEDLKEKNMENNGRIACFDYKGELIWKYKFRDTVQTIRDKYQDLYLSRLVEITKYKGKDVIFCNARHLYFPSAIYLLDIKTGERLDGTIWSQGHFTAGNIGDFNNDGYKELFIGGSNNGYESAFACIIDLTKLSGQTPSTAEYLFKDIKIGTFEAFFLFPKTDMCIYTGRRFNGTELTNFYEDTRTYHIGVNEKFLNQDIGPYYVFNNSLDSVHLQIGDAQQFLRDSLVIKGAIPPPFTNDPAYEQKLISNIKKWDGEKFIPFINKK